ncbi:12983_t:CDS:2 [Acaulospora morrowiae]|uniref:12983_t:CDS:1 n=1 Tax=Acaulospora morrowiae TaxID=94023 RepID=A0A9N9BRJ6_9GLOM|nr:12983_t:CDS:2 [Acaulospora morrowiae]
MANPYITTFTKMHKETLALNDIKVVEQQLGNLWTYHVRQESRKFGYVFIFRRQWLDLDFPKVLIAPHRSKSGPEEPFNGVVSTCKNRCSRPYGVHAKSRDKKVSFRGILVICWLNIKVTVGGEMRKVETNGIMKMLFNLEGITKTFPKASKYHR